MWAVSKPPKCHMLYDLSKFILLNLPRESVETNFGSGFTANCTCIDDFLCHTVKVKISFDPKKFDVLKVSEKNDKAVHLITSFFSFWPVTNLIFHYIEA